MISLQFSVMCSQMQDVIKWVNWKELLYKCEDSENNGDSNANMSMIGWRKRSSGNDDNDDVLILP